MTSNSLINAIVIHKELFLKSSFENYADKNSQNEILKLRLN